MALRSYGRINQINGVGGTWVEVQTDANGFNDEVFLTTLIQVLKLNLGESPFFSSLGIPAQMSVITQVFPTYYVNQTQQYFAPYFASLAITPVMGALSPTYNVNVVTHTGAQIGVVVSTGQTELPS